MVQVNALERRPAFSLKAMCKNVFFKSGHYTTLILLVHEKRKC